MPKNGKFDAKERKLRVEAVEYGFASVRMEGLEPGPEAELLARRFVKGQLPREEYYEAVRELARSIAQNGH